MVPATLFLTIGLLFFNMGLSTQALSAMRLIRSRFHSFPPIKSLVAPRYLSSSSSFSSGTPKSGTVETLKRYHLEGRTLSESKPGILVQTKTGHEIKTDLPKAMGGQNLAPQPVELLLASWMGCTQATALFVGRQMSKRILLDRLEFMDIQAVRDEQGALELPLQDGVPPSVPSRLAEITGTIAVYRRASRNQNTSISREELECLREQTEWRCPVANMILASGCKIHVEWVDGSQLPQSPKEQEEEQATR